MKSIIFTSLFILTTALSTYACDCFEILSHRREFKRAKAVFVGEVVKIENPDADTLEKLPEALRSELGYLVTFKVVRSWKGAKTEQLIWDHLTHEACSNWKFKVGEKYLIYAHKVKGILVGAEFCTRTRPLETTDPQQIREFRELESF